MFISDNAVVLIRIQEIFEIPKSYTFSTKMAALGCIDSKTNHNNNINLLNSTCLTWRRYLRIMAFALYWVGLPCGLLRLLSARRYKLFLLQEESRLFDESESCPKELDEGDDIDDLWEHVGFNRSANAKFIFGWLMLLLWLVLGSIHPNAAIFVLNV